MFLHYKKQEVHAEMWLMGDFASLLILIIPQPFQMGIYDGLDLYKQASVWL